MKVNNPTCPRCGCPPRYMLGNFQVRVGISVAQGSITKTGEKFVGKPTPGGTQLLECGGGHQWLAELVPEQRTSKEHK